MTVVIQYFSDMQTFSNLCTCSHAQGTMYIIISHLATKELATPHLYARPVQHIKVATVYDVCKFTIISVLDFLNDAQRIEQYIIRLYD